MTFTPKESSDWCQNERSLNSYLVAQTLQWSGGDLRELPIRDSLWMNVRAEAREIKFSEAPA